MKLSTKGRYGLQAMYELALCGERPMSIKTVALRQSISEPYLEQLFASLKKSGLIKAKRGAQGGYVLARSADQITIGELLRTLEGSVNITDCLGETDCGTVCSCPARGVFEAIQQSIDSVLDNMTLQDMVDKQPTTNS